MDPDQIVPYEQSDLGPHCLSKRLKTFQQATTQTGVKKYHLLDFLLYIAKGIVAWYHANMNLYALYQNIRCGALNEPYLR